MATFEVTGWEADSAETANGEPETAPGGPTLGQATVRKRFAGDLAGESVARLLMCQADAADLAAGAGYVAREVVRGTLAGRSGTFVMQHWGLSEGESRRTGGHVVPGSATGKLTGLTGTVEIAVAPDGEHTLTLEYELP